MKTYNPETGFTVRRAGEEDLALARQVLVEIDGRTVTDDAPTRALLADPNWYLLVASANSDVLGGLWGCSLRRAHRPEPEFLLYEIGVRESHRKRGIGQGLVRAFATEARKAGASEIWVLTNASNEPAMAMYLGAGFTRRNPDDVMLSLALD